MSAVLAGLLLTISQDLQSYMPFPMGGRGTGGQGSCIRNLTYKIDFYFFLLSQDPRGNFFTKRGEYVTNVDKVFTAGGMGTSEIRFQDLLYSFGRKNLGNKLFQIIFAIIHHDFPYIVH